MERIYTKLKQPCGKKKCGTKNTFSDCSLNIEACLICVEVLSYIDIGNNIQKNSQNIEEKITKPKQKIKKELNLFKNND